MASSNFAAGRVAEEMEGLGWQMTWLGSAVFLLVLALLVIGLLRQPTDGKDQSRVTQRWMLGGGVVLPTLLVTVVFLLTLVAMRATSLETDRDTVTIEVVGHQWWWEVTYPRHGVVTANEVHLPSGRPVRLVVTSADVIHSIWVPDLGGKIDMMPEDVNELVIQAEEEGVFDGACAEFCGLQHARMRFVAVASREEQFTAWLDKERSDASQPAGEAARRGEDVFLEEGCGECHTVRGTAANGREGPDLTHLAARRHLGAGTLEHTPQNLRAWVDDPHQFKEGVKMPGFSLSSADMDALVAYLESLE